MERRRRHNAHTQVSFLARPRPAGRFQGPVVLLEHGPGVVAQDAAGFGEFHATRLAVPGMKKKSWGRIVNIASAHALVASPFKSAYVAAKHGIAGLTKTAALELAEHGITVNAVCPGYVMTPLVEKQIPEQAKARGITEQQVISDVLLAAQPTKCFVTVEELTAVVNFLCTDNARSITGTALPVDGGWTAH